MGMPLVGKVRRWLETVPDYRATVTRERRLEDGLAIAERLVLIVLADFEQLHGGACPTLERIGRAIGRKRRQTFTIVESLRTLGLLQVVRAAAQHHPTVYRIIVPDVQSGCNAEASERGNSYCTPEIDPAVQSQVASVAIGPLRSAVATAPKLLTERKENDGGARAHTSAAAASKRCGACRPGLLCVDCTRERYLDPVEGMAVGQ